MSWKKTLAIAAGAALGSGLVTLTAQQERPVTIWKAADLLKKGDVLATKLDAYHSASESLGVAGNRSFLVAHREGDGQAEWHAEQADIMTILSGETKLIYGGEVVNGKETGPGEVRGDSIKGGREVTLGPGDVFHIPAKVAHQMKITGKLTYFVAKVKE